MRRVCARYLCERRIILLASTGTLLEIVNLFTDMGLTAFVGIGAVIGAVGYLFGRMAKGGR